MNIDNKTIRAALKQIDQGLSNRAIARHLSISPTTVAKIRKLNQNCMLGIDEILATNDVEMRRLLGLVKVYNPHKIKSIKTHPDWAYIDKEMSRPDMTLELLWQEFRKTHPDGIGYSQFCEQYRKYKKTSRPSKRQIYKAGEMVQVDFCGRKVPIYNERTGTVIVEAEIFVAILPASGYIYCTAVSSQKAEDWQLCHIRMFEYFGGVPLKLVTDNLKSAVISHNSTGIQINPSYSELADHYDIIITPSRPRKPKDKSMAELAVRIVQMGILAKLRNHRFFSLDELNHTLSQELCKLNTKTTKRYPESRYVCFSKTDEQFLNPLPAKAYEICQWLYNLKVTEFYMITLEHASYSVPYQFIGQRVDVKLTDNKVLVYLHRELIAEHQHITTGSSILHEHMPRNHQLQDEMQPDKLLAWAQNIGKQTAHMVQKIMHNKSGYANNLKKLNQLKRYLLEHKVPNMQIEQGFDYAQRLNICAVDRIISVFKNKVYQKTEHPIMPSMEDLDVVFTSNQLHENIRGSNYYANEINQNAS